MDRVDAAERDAWKPASALSENWTCSMCTFINHSGGDKCSVCFSKRLHTGPPPSAAWRQADWVSLRDLEHREYNQHITRSTSIVSPFTTPIPRAPTLPPAVAMAEVPAVAPARRRSACPSFSCKGPDCDDCCEEFNCYQVLVILMIFFCTFAFMAPGIYFVGKASDWWEHTNFVLVNATLHSKEVYREYHSTKYGGYYTWQCQIKATFIADTNRTYTENYACCSQHRSSQPADDDCDGYTLPIEAQCYYNEPDPNAWSCFKSKSDAKRARKGWLVLGIILWCIIPVFPLFLSGMIVVKICCSD